MPPNHLVDPSKLQAPNCHSCVFPRGQRAWEISGQPIHYLKVLTFSAIGVRATGRIRG